MIRRFEPGDLDDILRIEGQAFPKSAYQAETFLHYHRLFPDTFLVFERGTVLGYILFAPDGHILSLAVALENRRQGIGTRLMHACRSACRGGRLVVEVRTGNIGAQRFYEKLGFQRTSSIPLYYGTEDAYVMEKRI